MPSALELLADEAAGCTLCGLAAGRNTVVFGTGDPDADLMFVVEGPGADRSCFFQNLNPFNQSRRSARDRRVEGTGYHTRPTVTIRDLPRPGEWIRNRPAP